DIVGQVVTLTTGKNLMGLVDLIKNLIMNLTTITRKVMISRWATMMTGVLKKAMMEEEEEDSLGDEEDFQEAHGGDVDLEIEEEDLEIVVEVLGVVGHIIIIMKDMKKRNLLSQRQHGLKENPIQDQDQDPQGLEVIQDLDHAQGHVDLGH
ncbi:unnamed protein product, partial [Meganyctiphanes norvegica]